MDQNRHLKGNGCWEVSWGDRVDSGGSSGVSQYGKVILGSIIVFIGVVCEST